MKANSTSDSALDRDFSPGSYLLYVLPAIITYVFNGIYSTADGAFIEHYEGPYAIAAVSLYYPVLSLVLGIGTMTGAGGGVALAAYLGEKKKDEADRLFSQLVIVTALIGTLTALAGNIFSAQILHLLGATAGNMEYASTYFNIMITTSPVLIFAAFILPVFMAEGKTTPIAVTSIMGGVLNIVLDYVFMGIFKLGISGAAWATMTGYSLPVLYGIYFYNPFKKKESSFRLVLSAIEPKKILFSMYNGSSEMISFLAGGVTALVMNHLAYDLYREAGVSVVSVFLYIQFLVMAVFLGMTAASEPVISYNYGEKNLARLKHVCSLSIFWTSVFSILISIILGLFYKPITGIFFDSTMEPGFYELGCLSLIYAVPACLITGFNIFISGLFTAFLKGGISALLSVLRTFVFFVAAMYALTFFMGADGLWLSWFGAELLCLIISIAFLARYGSSLLKAQDT